MDQKLMQQIYDQYHRELYLYLFGLCRSRDAAEDLMQDTFLKALLSLNDSHPNFRAWLYTVAHRLFLDRLRKESRITKLEDSRSRSDEDLFGRMIADETRSALYRAIGTLEPRKREILLLQYFSGLPQKEIAEILGIRPEYVRVLAGRARRELKQQMEEWGYGL